MLDKPSQRTRAELDAALPYVAAARGDAGPLEMIVVRPEHGIRRMRDTARLSAAGGITGDHWSKGCWLTTEDGHPHPDVQISFMGLRALEVIAGGRENWPLAGNNLIVDMDLSPGNLPPGTRVALGSATLEITEEPNKGCAAFIDHYGRDACVFVNTGPGWDLRMRGVFARVVKDGDVRLGDVVRKL